MISIATLLGGYRTGYFPMAAHGKVGWYSPARRGVIPLERFKVPRRLARVLRQGRFQCSVNRSFRDVIAACASKEDTRGNWIDDEIFEIEEKKKELSSLRDRLSNIIEGAKKILDQLHKVVVGER